MAAQAVSRSARVAFLLIAVAAVGGLYAVQQLRHSDPVVMGVRRTPAFSPTGTGPRLAGLSFWLRRSDTAAVSVVDARGDEVRLLSGGRSVPAFRRANFTWDGRDAKGRLAADGWYAFRIGLARQGRSLTIPSGFRLDLKPATPVVSSIAPAHPPGPAVLPGPKLVSGAIGGTRGRDTEGFVLRTDVVPAKIVRRMPLANLAKSIIWDGRVYGHAAPEGVYLLGLAVTDRAGNRGTAPERLTPVPGPARGMPGVTVRHLGVEVPALPLRPGARATVSVDARGHQFSWSLRSLLGGEPVAKGRGRGSRLSFRVPRIAGGALGLSVSSGPYRVTVPVAVDSHTRKLLVVMPAIRWQGLAPVDGNGDGLPDLLPLGRSASVGRLMPSIPGGLDGLRDKLLPLMEVLAQAGIRADFTTDIALARDRRLAYPDRRGVVLAGDETWLPAGTLKALDARVRRGGWLLDLGLDSLRRTVVLRGGLLSRPSLPSQRDALGGVPAAPAASSAWLLTWKDRIGLFSTTGGRIFAPAGAVGTASVEAPGPVVAAAGTEAGILGIAAWKRGRGVYIRPGLPNLAANALAGPTTFAFLQKALTLTAGH